MPTPFYHLSLAEEIIAHPDLPDTLRAFLKQEQCAFFLGKTAPDVQTISGQTRVETHFFSVPPEDSVFPWVRVLTLHLDLSDGAALPPAQAAFVAGYLCHLQADYAWVDQIFSTYFSRDLWPDNHRRFYLYNALRVYLDERALAGLPKDVGACVGGAEPDNWLPFAADADLREWRDFLADQLAPGAEVQTAEIFAIRMGVDATEFAELIGSDEWLESELFVHISRQRLVEYRHTVIEENIQLLVSYLSPESDIRN